MPTSIGERTRTLLQAAKDGNLLDIGGRILHRSAWESDIPATSTDTRIIQALIREGTLSRHPTGQLVVPGPETHQRRSTDGAA